MTEQNRRPGRQRRPYGFLAGGGEMGQAIRAHDWAATPLGPVASWPQSLRSAISILLPSKAQIVLFWGPELVAIYNDAYAPVFGAKHPWALARPARDCWSEVWHVLGPLFEGVVGTGQAFWAKEHPFFLQRQGFLEETYFDVSYDPVRVEDGSVGGIFCIVSEQTGRVLGARRLRTLRELGTRTADAKSAATVCREAVAALATDPADVPFSLLYLADAAGQGMELVGAGGLGVEDPASGLQGLIADVAALAPVHEGRVFEVDANRLLVRPPEAAAERVLVLPIASAGQVAGALVAGVSRCLRLAGDYRDFFELAAARISAAIANARAYEEERKRAEALAEIDRAKTVFFSNISHEFRTPLTLMLAPLEDLLAGRDASVSAAVKEQLEVVHRNNQRLLKLVNTLLDFSRLEAGRASASYRPTDLAAFTAELASAFRSACERAGVRLVVNCPALPEQVYVDRDMWEKIVLNLVSNALKFTLQGEIEVRLETAGRRAQLTVRDTGTGIPPEELPHMFERFHRGTQTRGRTHEGTGIGLALVQELVKLHGGEVKVASALGQGSRFSVTIPFGTAHLAAERIAAGGPGLASTATGPGAFVAEALRWVSDAVVDPETGAPAASSPERRARIVWADDNADMRDYVRRLLAERFEVESFADGEAALQSALADPPDLVLSDVMMPKLDGSGLLKKLREDPRTSTVPVILLSARAGEESRVAGLEAGADDYVVKPFSARELLARVGAQLALARMRREAAEARRRWEFIFEHADWAVAVVDARTNILQAVNPAFARMHGLSVPELVGRPLADTFAPESRPGFDALVRTIHERGSNVYESIHVRADGSRFPVLTHVSVFQDEGGQPLFRAATFEDITQRKRAEQERQGLLERTREARDEAERADRLKDEFLATLAHELRSPLNAIVGWLHLLRDGPADAETARKAVETIHRNAQAQSQLISDILDVSRISSGKMRLEIRPVDPRRVIEAALETVTPTAEARGVRLEPVLDPKAGPVSGDPDRLQQVVWNLLSNAIKFAPAKRGHVHVRLQAVDSQVRLTVEDNGPGIEPDFLPHVFERFRQADSSSTRRHHGLGLGLAIVRHLVELHGGMVRAENREGRSGAVFTIDLPLLSVVADDLRPPAAERHPRADRTVWLDAAPSLAGLHILVVDDESDSRDVLVTVLEHCGARVRAAGSAREGLAALLAERPDVLVADIEMPEMNGYDLMRLVRALAPEQGGLTPAAALTAYASTSDRMRALDAGFQIHIPKPVQPAELATVVASLARRVGPGPSAA